MTRSDRVALLRSPLALPKRRADRYGMMLLQLYPFKQSRSRCADFGVSAATELVEVQSNAALQIAMHSGGRMSINVFTIN
jgi:hypothetical protein